MLVVIPITFRDACAFVAKHHRHHRPPQGMKFCVAVADDTGEIRGVAIVGRPVARRLDDGWTLEVTRTCTDGTKNANSMLYGAAWRAARALGYRRIVTYTLPEESGASLRAAGWQIVHETRGRPWTDWRHLKRANDWPLGAKLRWEADHSKS